MKAVIFFFLCTLLTIPTVLGQIKIGDNPQNIDGASVLELESSSKVLVITRVNTAEMDAITPQRGGMVYNTDTACIHYYDGAQWINLCDAVSFEITNDPIINNRSTIEITQSAQGYNLEVAKNSILGDNIVDGGIGPDDIQDNSITQEKLAAESVGSSEIRQNAVGTEEIRDGSIVPTDLANFIPRQVLTTDENGIPQWEDANEIYELTFSKIDTTLSITRSTTPGTSSVNLGALIGSDDQNLGSAILTNEELTIEIENGASTTANLSEFATDVDLTSGLSLKEDLSNKDPNPVLGTSNDAYPTQNAVKTYVDSQIGGVTTDDDITSAALSDTSVLRINEGTSFVEVSLANLEESQAILDETIRATLAENTNTTNITTLQNNKEDVVNKSDVTTLGNSTTLYPTQNAVKVYVDNEIADIVTSGGSDPVNEQNLTFAVVAGELIITDIAGPLSVPLTDIDTNTQLTDAEIGAFGYIKIDNDNQTLNEVLTEGNDANGTTITNLPNPSLNSDAATKEYVDNEIAGLPAGSDNQQLTLESGNLLTLTNSTPPINLSPFLNNQTAAEVPVTATPGNYIPTAANVEGHLEGIDAALLNSGSTEEADGITITGIGTNVGPFKIEPGPDGQYLNTTGGVVTWANLPTGTGGTVEADAVTIEGNGSTLNPLQVRADGITTAQILDGTIGTLDIADANVTAAKIAPNVAGTGLSQNGTTGALEVTNPVVLAANVPTGTLTINNSAVTPTSVIQLTVRESDPANIYSIQLANQNTGSFTVRIFEIAVSGNTKTEVNAAWSYVVINP